MGLSVPRSTASFSDGYLDPILHTVLHIEPPLNPLLLLGMLLPLADLASRDVLTSSCRREWVWRARMHDKEMTLNCEHPL